MKPEDMNIKIQKASIDGKTANKGSCRELAEYICHEDQGRIDAGLEPLPFTTPNGEEVTTDEVIAAIDTNAKGLKNAEDKFYHLVISPSENEIQAMGDNDREVYESGKKLARAISDEYAQDFHREGLVDYSGLLLYWKPHYTRGNNGELQFHIHGIVSRKTADINGRKMKISPLTNHVDTQDGPVKGGFDRKTFFGRCEKLFDQLFNYDRKVAETFDYQNTMAHGTVEEKAEQAELLAKEGAAEMKASITAGLDRRRKRLKAERDIEEVVALLTPPPTPPTSNKLVMTADEKPNLTTIILRCLENNCDSLSLQLALASEGLSCREVKAVDGGIEDLLIIQAGMKTSAKDIMTEAEHRSILSHWCRITGQIPAYKLREKRAAEDVKKAAEALRVSQRKHGGPKIR